MKESLSGILGEGAANIVQFILFFAAILVAIFIVYALIKRISRSSAETRHYTDAHHEPSSRLTVVDAAIVDHQRKLVLVRRDDVEHLILIGGPTDIVVEQNITADSDYVRGSRITEAQIARYQNNHTDDSDLGTPAHPAAQHRPDTRALENVSTKPVPAPSFATNKPVEAPQSIAVPKQDPVRPTVPVQQASYRSQPMTAPTQAQASSSAPAFTKPVPQTPVQNVKPVTAQPHTVMPAAPVAKPATHRAHPAYPLSQVSQGVLTSTSTSAATAATATVAATSSAASGRLDSVTPQKTSKPEPAFEPDHSNEADEFASLDDALNQALFNDQNTDFIAQNKPAVSTSEDNIHFMLEEELLSSLDIDADGDMSTEFEDEMERMLGELSINPER